ncbi:MAG: hypothetical protein MR280_07975 [Clostridium sp.]|nr:hypothetical protein [Clostridium sp.]
MRNVSAFLICLSGSLQVAVFAFAPEKLRRPLLLAAVAASTANLVLTVRNIKTRVCQ